MQPSRPASSSTRPSVSPLPRPPQVNTQTKVLDTVHGRILCIADIRGNLSSLNDLAREANAKAIIHTGDFGFFEASSLDRINDRTLRHLTMYSPLMPSTQRSHLLAPEHPPMHIRSNVTISLLSEFPLLLSGQIKLQVPVFTVWGACEDVVVLEKFRANTYSIDNFHILDEATTRCLDVGGVKLRLFGLGGALVLHKLFDNGEGNATIAGGQGTMWTTALQMGELVDTAQRVFDPSETRLLVTHASPGRDGIIAQLGLVLKTDLTISAGLHFRYASSYNEFSVQSDFEGFRHKLCVGKEGFDKVWENVKVQVEAVVDDNQRVLLDKALSVVDRVPLTQSTQAIGGSLSGEEPAWKNCWNWNLCDAAYGSLVLDIKDGRVSTELKSQGFNFAYRRSSTPSTLAPTPNSNISNLPVNATSIPAKSPPPTSSERPAPPHVVNSTPTSPPPNGSDSPRVVANSTKPNGAAFSLPSDKAKKKDKKDKKDKERAERDTKDREGGNERVSNEPMQAPPPAPLPKSGSGRSTPVHDSPTPDVPKENENELKSPATESTGVRTPTGRKPTRHPWTLFMKTVVAANETDIREFFGEAKSGIIRVSYPQSAARSQRMAFVEFGDEEAMKAGLSKHVEKLKDTTVEVKVAADREGSHRGGLGRGRGRGGAFAARNFAEAGLTRGTPQSRKSAKESPASGASDGANNGAGN